MKLETIVSTEFKPADLNYARYGHWPDRDDHRPGAFQDHCIPFAGPSCEFALTNLTDASHLSSKLSFIDNFNRCLRLPVIYS